MSRSGSLSDSGCEVTADSGCDVIDDGGHDVIDDSSRSVCCNTTSCEQDFRRLRRNHLELQMSGFYHDTITQADADALLEHAPLGTFLLRNSSHPRFLYALSMKTSQGATSVRIHYINGLFGFDGDHEWMRPKKLVFKTVISLVDYYASQQRKYGRSLEMKGKADRKCVIVELRKPLRRRQVVPSLAHLSRMAIHSSLNPTFMRELSIAQLPLLKASDVLYLEEYPYSQ